MISKRALIAIVIFFAMQANIQAATIDSVVINKVAQLAAQVQKKYAPDRRTEYFQTRLLTSDPLTYSVEVSKPEALTELKSLIATADLKVSVNGEVLPAADLGEKIYGVANLSVINNRYTPSHSAEMATQTLLGTPVKVLKKERGYYFVRTPDNYLSYTESAGITLMNKAEFDAWQKAPKLIYTAIYGHALSAPNPDAAPISDLVTGNILQIVSQDKSWYKVSFPDKRTAYIPVSSGQLFSEWEKRANPDAAQILKTARTMLGVPYLWGGTSIKGVDCSGFTKTSYFLNGIVLPRDASQQALVGEKVDIYEADTVNIQKCLKNLKPGDLLFFAADKQTKRVTHTALYIGNGEFIHSAGLVRINNMHKGTDGYADFESRTLVSARRMLNSVGQPEITRVDNHPYYNKTE